MSLVGYLTVFYSKSKQHNFYPNNNNASLRKKVTTISKIITYGKMLFKSLIEFPQLIL